MKIIDNIEEFDVIILSQDFAKKHVSALVEIIDQIPLVDYSSKEILAEKKRRQDFLW